MLSVVVTAENGSVRTYTITAQVAQAPTVFLSYGSGKLGVVKDIAGVTAPAGFTVSSIPHNGETIPAWANASGQTLLYLVDESSHAGFYLYSPEVGVLSPYLPLTDSYVYVGVPTGKQTIPGLTFGSVTAFGQTLDGWTYQDASLPDFSVLYLMDTAGTCGYYTYDSQNDTLQRFSGAVFSDDGGRTLRLPMLYVYIAGGAAALLLVLVIVLAALCGRRGRKLRLLSAPALPTSDAEIEAPSADAAAPQEPGISLPQDVSPAPQAEPDPTSHPEEASSAPELSTDTASPAPEETPLSIPDAADDAPTPEPSSAEAAPESPAPADAPPAQEETPPSDASLEDTLRQLPLDEKPSGFPDKRPQVCCAHHFAAKWQNDALAAGEVFSLTHRSPEKILSIFHVCGRELCEAFVLLPSPTSAGKGSALIQKETVSGSGFWQALMRSTYSTGPSPW